MQPIIENHLLELFGRVAGSTAAPHPATIDLVWVTSIPELITANPAPNELVIFFYERFNNGLLQRYGTWMMSNYHDDDPEAQTRIRSFWSQTVSENQAWPPPELGITLVETINGRPDWYCAEVHVSDVQRAGLDMPGNITELGVSIANIAYHEAMHVKVETYRAQHTHNPDYDMHAEPDGLGNTHNHSYHSATSFTAADIDDMKRGLLAHSSPRVRLPTGPGGILPLPLPARAPAADAQDLSGLDGL